MNGIHILNKVIEGSNVKRLGLDPIKGSSPLQFKSGYWDPISMGFRNVDEVREKLVGGMVFLHNDKNTDSFVGGLVLEIDEVILDEEEEYLNNVLKFLFFSINFEAIAFVF